MQQFSGKRIKTPERGLLAMHPFVDVLEGRNLFTGTAHDGVLDVTAVINVPVNPATISPWSNEPIDQASAAHVDDAAPGLITAEAPAQIELDASTTQSAFATGQTIGDKDQFLFGNNLWDRRGKQDSVPLPTDEQLAEARVKMQTNDDDASTLFRTGRALTGAMRPFLTMNVGQSENLFAA